MRVRFNPPLHTLPLATQRALIALARAAFDQTKAGEYDMDVLHEDDALPIAKVCHEANRAYCLAMGDDSQPAWEDAPEWQRKSAISGVQFHHANPDAGPDASHANWLIDKERDGWKYGPVKDPVKKEHPCFVPYELLPVEQRAKDYIFRAICHASF